MTEYASEHKTFDSRLVLEKKLCIETTFKTTPKFKRRTSPIYHKCEDLMEALWNEGYRKQIAWNTLRDYIVQCCGGFRTTVQDYLGKRAEYFKSRGREGCLKSPSRKGYLEKFGFIEFLNRKVVFLLHERVDREYHRVQTNVVDFSLSISPEGNENGEATENETITTTTTKRERETNIVDSTIPQLSPSEEAILNAKPCESEKPLPKITWTKQPYKPPPYEEPFNPNLHGAKPLSKSGANSE